MQAKSWCSWSCPGLLRNGHAIAPNFLCPQMLEWPGCRPEQLWSTNSWRCSAQCWHMWRAIRPLESSWWPVLVHWPYWKSLQIPVTTGINDVAEGLGQLIIFFGKMKVSYVSNQTTRATVGRTVERISSRDHLCEDRWKRKSTQKLLSKIILIIF